MTEEQIVAASRVRDAFAEVQTLIEAAAQLGIETRFDTIDFHEVNRRFSTPKFTVRTTIDIDEDR